MKVGYARTSTLDQTAGLEAQIRDLTEAGCERVFSEQASSVGERPELSRLMEFVREGDTLYVTKLDRLARSVSHLGEINSALKKKSVYLNVLNLGMDTSSPTGELVYHLLGAIAQFERSMMLERQREGIAKAKKDGKYKGRKPTALMKSAQIKELFEKGERPSHIAKTLKIARSSVYRILSLS